jgi:hypothetical protein
VGGAYVRAFSSGFVAVNPTSSTVRVAVPTGMVDADGAYSSSVELRPHGGLIFRSA